MNYHRSSAWMAAALRYLLPVALFAATLVMFCSGVRSAADTQRQEAVRLAEQSIRRAAVSCYCIEGEFPESYAYLRDNYGVMVNEDRYAVHYSVFASNLMPDVTVVER